MSPSDPSLHRTPDRSRPAVVRMVGGVVGGVVGPVTVTVVMLVLVLAVALVGVLAVGAGRADASSCAETVPDGQLRVVVVVDAGDGGGPSATCLVVPAGTTGSQALARRAAEIGASLPRYAGSGLLCAIDGLPAAPACGDRNAGGYRYWAYFNGSSGAWEYGTYNPFIRRLADGDIEGWRFVDGAGNGSDPPPRIAPARSLFPALAPPAPSAAGGAATGATGASPSGPAGPTGGSTTDPVTAAGDAVVAAGVDPSGPAASIPADGPVELTVATVGSRSDGTGWLAVAAVVALIAAFGTGAVLRARRRA